MNEEYKELKRMLALIIDLGAQNQAILKTIAPDWS
jgi:hypothetical protein